LAIIGSLVLCTVVYILVAIAAVGSLNATALQESDAPLAAVLDEGAGISWAASLLAFGALIAITSVMVTVFYGQTRIFFAMARDGLMPRGLAQVNPRTGTPVKLTFGMGILIAALVMATLLVPSLTALLGRAAWWPRAPRRTRPAWARWPCFSTVRSGAGVSISGTPCRPSGRRPTATSSP